MLLPALLIIVPLFAGSILPARASTFQPHAPILISDNGGFTTANGVTGGSGTATDPYIIEGWEIGSFSDYGIRIQGTVDGYGRPGTTAHFVIRNVYVHDGNSSSDHAAVDLMGVANGLLENMTISKTKTAIAVYNSRNVTIANDLVQSNGSGISVGAYVKNVTVIGNNVLSNLYGGISVFYASVVVTGNNIYNNGFGDPYGGYGIAAGRRCDCLIVGNTVSNNRIGIGMFSGPSPFHNNFINNVVQAFAGCPYDRCVWTWDSGYPGGGNFWSDYAGVDNCSGPFQNVCPNPDGIGDTPYIMHIQPPWVLINNDRFPLMKPFAPAVSGTVSFGPATIGSQSNGEYLTAIVGLPKGYNASNLITSSIRLNGAIALASGATVSQSNGGGVLVVRFNMTQVRILLSKPGNDTLQLSGNLLTNTNFRPFEATATIRLPSP